MSELLCDVISSEDETGFSLEADDTEETEELLSGTEIISLDEFSFSEDDDEASEISEEAGTCCNELLELDEKVDFDELDETDELCCGTFSSELETLEAADDVGALDEAEGPEAADELITLVEEVDSGTLVETAELTELETGSSPEDAAGADELETTVELSTRFSAEDAGTDAELPS